jgi:hypothetical protein
VNPVASTTGAAPVGSAAPTTGATPPTHPAELPPAGTASGEAMNDAMSMIYELLAKDGEQQLASRKSDVATRTFQRKKALDDERAAHERERKADGDGSSGFFGSIGKLVKDVVDDATHLRVADCVTDFKDDVEAAWNSPSFWKDIESGAGSVFKGINTVFALAAALAVLQGDDAVDIIKNPDSASARHYGFAGKAALVLTAGIVSAATAGVATPAIIAGVSVALSAGGEAVSETHCLGSASEYVGLGLEAGSAATGMLATPTTNIDRMMNAMRGAEMFLEGATKVVEGAARARVAVFEGDAEEALADAKAAEHQKDRIDRIVRELLTEAKDVQQSHERALGSLREAMQTNDQTLLVAAGVRG